MRRGVCLLILALLCAAAATAAGTRSLLQASLGCCCSVCSKAGKCGELGLAMVGPVQGFRKLDD
jgi:hypothetical protein